MTKEELNHKITNICSSTSYDLLDTSLLKEEYTKPQLEYLKDNFCLTLMSAISYYQHLKAFNDLYKTLPKNSHLKTELLGIIAQKTQDAYTQELQLNYFLVAFNKKQDIKDKMNQIEEQNSQKKTLNS